MANGATLSLGALASGVTLSSARFCRRHAAAPSSALPLFPAHILIKGSGLARRRAAVFSSAAGVDVAVLQDAGATALVVGGAYALVSSFDNLTRRNVIEQTLSRKLVHIFSGLLFLASWPIFSTSTGARYFASLVPSLNCLRLVLNGLSLTTDEGLVKSVSREGKPEELLRGPLYYVLVLILCAIVFWRESPVGMISLAMMCGGDGIADIMGRRFGSLKIPYNPHKSWAGSISMFVFGFLVSLGMLYYFAVLGYIQPDWMQTVQRVALVALVATIVESLPTTGIVDDNISVPLASMVECDSEVVINLIRSTNVTNHPLELIVEDCTRYLKMPWESRIRHIHRTGNEHVDALARLGHDMSEDLCVRKDQPEELAELMNRDNSN